MNRPLKSAKLLSQAQLSEDDSSWHRAAYDDIATRLLDPGFPCIFSRNAFRKRILKLIFVENVERDGIAHLAEGLTEYVELSNEWDGRLDSAYPLLVAFSQDAVDAGSVREYHAFGWKVLQKLHEVDPAPWPEDVAKDPESESWSMTFNGMPLFCNMSNPAHQVRRSRNLGGHFILVINPRERFDVFAGDTPSGRKVRSNIRGRVDRYDGAPRSPALGTYGVGALEWRQYGLSEDNTERTDGCPFRFRSP
ncbi:YqcI/YcgG family protein [Actinomadura roseirufa]|uniref:YqcI/YcgG family protein n=1 Tax=Actinomadura roseirufa TaxID=2094049 RepID=UPI0010416CDD|nr:YqcI/YcgG family protein [Actinomadura roseirufa]